MPDEAPVIRATGRDMRCTPSAGPIMLRLLVATFAIALSAPIVARAQHRAAALLVLNKEEATLAIVDPASGAVAARVPTGDGPHEVAVSSDGALAFVTNYGAQAPGNT